MSLDAGQSMRVCSRSHWCFHSTQSHAHLPVMDSSQLCTQVRPFSDTSQSSGWHRRLTRGTRCSMQAAVLVLLRAWAGELQNRNAIFIQLLAVKSPRKLMGQSCQDLCCCAWTMEWQLCLPRASTTHRPQPANICGASTLMQLAHALAAACAQPARLHRASSALSRPSPP